MVQQFVDMLKRQERQQLTTTTSWKCCCGRFLLLSMTVVAVQFNTLGCVAFTTTSAKASTKSSITSSQLSMSNKNKLFFTNPFATLLNPFAQGVLNKPLLRPKVQVPDNFVQPEPKPLTVTKLDDLFIKRTIALAVRLGTSAFVLGWKIDTFLAPVDDGKYALSLGPIRFRDSSSVLQDAPRPKQPLILYEYTASPYCQRVREIANILDLTVICKPCPGARQSAFSKELNDRTGRQTVPYLIDSSTGVEMFESNDIINYLVSTYGPPEGMYDAKALWPITFEQFSIATSTWVAILLNIPGSQRQSNARPDNEQMEPITVYGYEASPFVRPVLAKLCALALPYKYVSCSRGSLNRQVVFEKTGRFQVPYIEDPNTGINMFESNEIVDYLDAVYTVK